MKRAIPVPLATFLLAGTVKGVIGLGLPTVSLAILTVAIDLPNAMALSLTACSGYRDTSVRCGAGRSTAKPVP